MDLPNWAKKENSNFALDTYLKTEEKEINKITVMFFGILKELSVRQKLLNRKYQHNSNFFFAVLRFYRTVYYNCHSRLILTPTPTLNS